MSLDLPEAALVQGYGGDTSIDAVPARALASRPSLGALRKSDVVLVTDGGSDPSTAPELRRAAERLNGSTSTSRSRRAFSGVTSSRLAGPEVRYRSHRRGQCLLRGEPAVLTTSRF